MTLKSNEFSKGLELVIRDWKPEYGVAMLRYYLNGYIIVSGLRKKYNEFSTDAVAITNELIKSLTKETAPKDVMDEKHYPLVVDNDGKYLAWSDVNLGNNYTLEIYHKNTLTVSNVRLQDKDLERTIKNWKHEYGVTIKSTKLAKIKCLLIAI